MRSCTEVLKNTAIVHVSETMNPEKLAAETDDKAKNRNDWGNDDYRSIILRNMSKEARE